MLSLPQISVLSFTSIFLCISSIVWTGCGRVGFQQVQNENDVCDLVDQDTVDVTTVDVDNDGISDLQVTDGHQVSDPLVSDDTTLLGVSDAETVGWGISADPNGNIYVAGWTYGNLDGQTLNGSEDAFVIKYNSSGTKLWTRLIGVSDASSTGSSTIGYEIDFDSSGNSYVTGYTTGNLDGQSEIGICDSFLVKFDTSGNKQWTRLLGTSLNYTKGRAISIDSSGNNIYLAGYTTGNLNGEMENGTHDVYVVKYDSSGDLQWVRLSGVPGQDYMYTHGWGISVDSNDNIFVTGSTKGDLDGETVTGYKDTFVIKYDASGTKQWTKLLGSPSESTVGRGISVDSTGNIYVTGVTYGDLDGQTLNGSNDAIVIKYDSSGTKLWTRLIGVSGQETTGYGITIGNNGDNIYLTGKTSGNLDGETLTGAQDVFVTKFNISGTKIWTKLLGVSGQETVGYGISLDLTGTIHVVGYTTGDLDGHSITGTSDLFVTKKLQD